MDLYIFSFFRGQIHKPGDNDGGDSQEFTVNYRALDLISKFDSEKNFVCDNRTRLYYTCETCQNDDKEVLVNMMSRAQDFWKYVCTEVIDTSDGYPGGSGKAFKL